MRSPKDIIPFNPLAEIFKIEQINNPPMDINDSASIGNDNVSKIYNPKCKDIPGQVVQTLDLINEDVENQYGNRIWYWGRKNITEVDNYYGEPQNVEFEGPKEMIIMINPTGANPAFLQFGRFTDVDMTLTISFHQWNRVWGKDRPPLEGDRFLVADENCTRPELQSPRVYVILTKIDVLENGFQGPYNSVYRWTLTAKRSTNSYETNAPEENSDLGNVLNVDSYKNEKFKSDQSDSLKNEIDIDNILKKNNPASKTKPFKRK